LTLLRTALSYEERTVQMTSILICCHNIASLHPWHKEQIGRHQPEGGIHLVMRLIKWRLTEQVDDENDGNDGNNGAHRTAVLEACWTFLWASLRASALFFDSIFVVYDTRVRANTGCDQALATPRK